MDSETLWLLLVDMQYNSTDTTDHSHTEMMVQKGGGKRKTGLRHSDTGTAVTEILINSS